MIIYLIVAVEQYMAQENPNWPRTLEKFTIKELGRKYNIPYTTLQRRCKGLVEGYGKASGGSRRPSILTQEAEGDV